MGELCKAALNGQLSSADRTWAEQCVRVLTEGQKQIGQPSPPVPSQPAPTKPAPSSPAPEPPLPPSTGFPGPNNTGVPAGTALTTYSGPCTITVPNTVIDAKTVNCDLAIRTNGVQIKRSWINGVVNDDENAGFGFTISDSRVNATPGAARQVTAVGNDNFPVLRS